MSFAIPTRKRHCDDSSDMTNENVLLPYDAAYIVDVSRRLLFFDMCFARANQFWFFNYTLNLLKYQTTP
jgi:hypothetical protein